MNTVQSLVVLEVLFPPDTERVSKEEGVPTLRQGTWNIDGSSINDLFTYLPTCFLLSFCRDFGQTLRAS